MIEQARDSVAKVARQMKKYADQNKRDVEFQVGGTVKLKLTPYIWKKISSISVGRIAYQLKLPDHLKVHPTFHVSY